MKGNFLFTILVFLLPLFSFGQQITYTDALKENSRDMKYEILGKVSGKILIFNNESTKYSVLIYNEDMSLKEKVLLDFIPNKTVSVNYIVYPGFFYLVYQYPKKGIVYSMAVKMDGDANRLTEPILLDTTKVGALDDDNVYTIVASEDKQKIMVFKVQEKDDVFNFEGFLYDSQMQLIHKSRIAFDYDKKNDVYSDFYLDNEGNLVFTKAVKSTNRDDLGILNLITKKAMEDSFSLKKLLLNKLYVDEVRIKVDNVNKRYVINSFYYSEHRGNLEGIYSSIWDAKSDTTYANVFTRLPDSVRSIAKESGSPKSAFNDFFLRNSLLKKDGGYLLIAEDYSRQNTGSNTWNRWDYLSSPHGNSYYSPYNSYYGYGSYYSPYNNYNNYNNTTRNYYYNILVVSFNKNGVAEWTNIINKEQSADNTDNFLSFGTFNTGTGIHFLFNSSDTQNPLVIDDVIGADGKLTRNPRLKSYDKGYDFMLRFIKQTGARQLIVPCAYRQQVCFAKVDF